MIFITLKFCTFYLFMVSQMQRVHFKYLLTKIAGSFSQIDFCILCTVLR